MKAWKVLVLCTIIAVTALSFSVALASAYYIGYHYYSFYLYGSGAPGHSDCAHSAYYRDILSIRAGIVSVSPTPYVAYVGYWSTIEFGEGTGDIITRTTPGYGPISPSGDWYGIWGNALSNPIFLYGKVKIVDDQPVPQ